MYNDQNVTPPPLYLLPPPPPLPSPLPQILYYTISFVLCACVFTSDQLIVNLQLREESSLYTRTHRQRQLVLFEYSRRVFRAQYSRRVFKQCLKLSFANFIVLLKNNLFIQNRCHRYSFINISIHRIINIIFIELRLEVEIYVFCLLIYPLSVSLFITSLQLSLSPFSQTRRL